MLSIVTMLGVGVVSTAVGTVLELYIYDKYFKDR